MAVAIDIKALRDYVDYFYIQDVSEREDIFFFTAELDDEYCTVVNEKRAAATKTKPHQN